MYNYGITFLSVKSEQLLFILIECALLEVVPRKDVDSPCGDRNFVNVTDFCFCFGVDISRKSCKLLHI
jgi:hypothetical protein